MTSPILLALIDGREDDALDLLAEKIAPRLAERLKPAEDREDRWLNTREAAAYLAVPTSTLHKLTAAREIPFEQDAPGARCYFKRSELDRWRREERGSTDVRGLHRVA